MPPSWIVLAFFAVSYGLPVPAVVLTGVTASTLGRTALYFLARDYLRLMLPDRPRKNMAELGQIINHHKGVMLPLIASFSILPAPSNEIYIAAGLARFDLWVLTQSFFVGRLINYSFLVGGAQIA